MTGRTTRRRGLRDTAAAAARVPATRVVWRLRRRSGWSSLPRRLFFEPGWRFQAAEIIKLQRTAAKKTSPPTTDFVSRTRRRRRRRWRRRGAVSDMHSDSCVTNVYQNEPISIPHSNSTLDQAKGLPDDLPICHRRRAAAQDSTYPLNAAHEHVHLFHGQPFSRAHFSTSR